VERPPRPVDVAARLACGVSKTCTWPSPRPRLGSATASMCRRCARVQEFLSWRSTVVGWSRDLGR